VATQVIMPKLGMAMKEGVIAKWLKQDGETVAQDEVIAVIMTKKITYELKASAAGVLRHKARVQETRPVGAIIAFITAPGEEVPEVEEGAPPPVEVAVAAGEPAREEKPTPPPAPAGGFVLASPAARRLASETGVELALVKGSGPGGRVTEKDVRAYLEARERVLITSAARKLAEEHGLDITTIKGSGPGGRIVEADVQSLIAAEAPPAAPPVEVPAGRAIPFVGVRQMIAENMVLSLQTMAQVTISCEVDVTELVELRERLKKDFQVTYTDLIVKATARALAQHPRLNATLLGDSIQLLEEISIGVGVALEEGLIVPVVRNADRLTLRQIGAAVRELAEKARSDSLSVDEITGGTFTITNLGAYGVDAFTPVINPPEVAILGVGRIVEKPAVYRGDIVKRAMMFLSLTFDHRIVDGAPAAAFLQTLADILAHPYYLAAE
jgi:pyruvate dehydrogenase E2 component (dihydrolipoamide acetyltransferase)